MIRIKVNKKTSDRVKTRYKNRARIRKKVKGTEERPRMAVFRSTKHMYAQLINDETGQTLASASSVKMGGKSRNKDIAKQVGMELAKKALEKNIKNIVFDRSGYVYHGRVQAMAEGAREGGLSF